MNLRLHTRMAQAGPSVASPAQLPPDSRRWHRAKAPSKLHG